MDSPLAVIDGDVTSAVLTTFTIELPFIDQWLLPRLTQAGVRNIIILADEGQTAEQLAVADSRKAGQDYHLSTFRCRGSFHPKVIYLSGPSHQRACISSANLTAAGQLRNLETAAAITSDEPNHLAALEDIRSFFRQLVEDQPLHVVEAVALAIGDGQAPPEDVRPAVRFVSNLRQPIIEQIPRDPTDGFSPFVGTEALGQLHELNAPRLWADERRVDAFAQHEALDLSLRPIKFGFDKDLKHARVAHGKALWHQDGWCLVGSPNLTAPGLLRSADTGNVEAALLFEYAPGFSLPDHEDADRPTPPPEVETHRRSKSAPEPTRVFDAVLEGELRIEGIDAGMVEYATISGWAPLGEVQSGVVIYDEQLTPKRLRVKLPDGTYAYAIVHRPSYLRARSRAPRGRSASVVEALPIDLQGVSQLEEVLGDLFTLDELVSEERLKRRSATATESEEEDAPIDTWRPARPDDDPKVPELYRSLYPGEPDALLALIRRALGIEPDQPNEIAPEDNEELDHDGIDGEVEESLDRVPRSTAVVVRRYRSSLLKVLDRGAQRITKATEPAMRDLIFLTVLRFHEALSSLTVRVTAEDARAIGVTGENLADETVEIRLVEPEQLLSGRLELLLAYASVDPDIVDDCASTLLAHLSAAVDTRDQLSDTKKRKLDDLCYQVGPRVLANGDPTVTEFEWLSPQAMVDLLQPYADRIDWDAIVVHAESEGWLVDADLELEPHPVITGQGSIVNWFNSPAWTVLGHACIAGYEDDDPFGVVVHSVEGDGPFLMHALRVQPTDRKQTGDKVQEVLWRRSDRKWLVLTYQGFRRKSADDIMTTVGARRVLDRLTKSKRTEMDAPPGWFTDLQNANASQPVPARN